MLSEYKRCSAIAQGGYKCPCCGPAPSKRTRYRRMVRRKMKAQVRKIVLKELLDG